MGDELPQELIPARGQDEIVHSGARLDALGEEVERSAVFPAHGELEMAAQRGGVFKWLPLCGSDGGEDDRQVEMKLVREAHGVGGAEAQARCGGGPEPCLLLLARGGAQDVQQGGGARNPPVFSREARK